MQQTENNSGSVVMSYLTLRKVVGLLGVSLPFILLFGAPIVFNTGKIEESISDYYHTGMGDVFVGTIFVIGTFLLSYKGYEKKDDRAGDLACFFAVGLALFPTSPSDPSTFEQIVGYAHAVFAALFFLTLAYFSLCLFTKTEKNKPPTKQKRRRNQIYRVCGYTILVSVVLVIIYYALEKFEPDLPSYLTNLTQVLGAYKPVFWLEALLVVAFGVSWLTKGEAILRDQAE